MPKPPLCLNMIVKNEAARIERCLKSVLPYVKSAVILDTGSTDDTKEIIARLCRDHGVHYGITDGPFVDFSQARNLAFARAKEVNNSWGYCQFALLVDADMELVVDDPKAFAGLDATALSYDMIQKGGAISYANRRIANLNAKSDPYVGVTHEYLDLPAAGMIAGAHFVDHADGANRVNKFKRDADLLEAALKDEPNNGRYWYYLGNTYRDWGMPHPAADAYEQRIKLGGWDEETHSAMMNLAMSLKDQNDIDGFVRKMVDAYNFRPSRAEPLYDLAKFYRERGDNAAAMLFAKAGLDHKRPSDALFVNDFVYAHGLRYEYSVAGYYDEKERPRAFEITNALALDPTCPADHRWSARGNLFWYTKRLSDYCPSFAPFKLDFIPPHGYHAMNPSVTIHRGLISCNIRCANYQINEHGAYVIHGGGEAIDTRNFIVHLGINALGQTHNPAEVLWHRPPPKFDLVIGLEDIRLWHHCGDLHFSATVREQCNTGTCQIAVGKLTYDERDTKFMNVAPDWRVVSGEEQHEKNWMPMPSRTYSAPRFAYRLDTIVELGTPNLATKTESKLAVGDISGSSQLIPFKAGYLACVHEASNDPCGGKRTYWHRFAWFDKDAKLRRLSLPFVFFERQIEFCAGLARHPNNHDLVLSFGVRDAEAYVATVSEEDVGAMLLEATNEG